MNKRIFAIIANRGYGLCAPHIFGSIVSTPQSGRIWECSFDYSGGKDDLSPQKNSESICEQILIFPISDHRAIAFEKIVKNISILGAAGRWPFIFSDPPFDAKPVFTPYKNAQKTQLPRQKAVVNCVTAFNAVARYAGIDLKKFYEQWHLIRDAYDAARGISDLADRAYSRREILVNKFKFEIVNIALDGGFKAKLIKDNEFNDTPDIYPSDLIQTLIDEAGGYTELCSHFDCEPFDCESEPLPPYLEAEFAEYGVPLPPSEFP